MKKKKKEIDALGRDTEDEATKTVKVEDNEEEKNENDIPRSSPLCTFEEKICFHFGNLDFFFQNLYLLLHPFIICSYF